jgi:predicted Zn-dependent protease
MHPRPSTVRLALPLAALALACATNPVTGKRQLSFISEKDEIALGLQSAEQIKAQMGAYPDPKVQAYVSRIGLEMAKKSERPELPWSFTVLDDPTVNAFALPGGPVFVTRGILTHMNSEAELASVLGHEIGHITARHSVEQMSKQQLAQLGLGVGMVFSESLRNVGQAAVAGMQLLFLKYGRDAERQSDELGFKYMVGQGYDPREMAEMFVTLERASALAGAGRVPEWASTHPDPGNRADKARERASKVEGDLARLQVGREAFVANLDGMVFGDDPRQGFFQGNAFLHPALKFKLELPQGWKTQNMPQAVVAVSPKEDAAVQLTVAGKLSPEEATKQFFAQEGVKPAQLAGGGAAVSPGASYFEAQTQQGVVRGVVSFRAHGGMTFQIVGFTPAEGLAAYDPAFRQVIGSFSTLTDPAALAVQPARVQLVKLPRDMTIEQFAAEYPSNAPVEAVALVNGVDKGATMRAGSVAKRVVGGPPAAAAQPRAAR